jgi:hypothetical protein
LRNSDAQLLATNDDWQSGSEAGAIRASGIPPQDPRESALIATLGPGSYTALVSGSEGDEGIGLVEIYDVDPE